MSKDLPESKPEKNCGNCEHDKLRVAFFMSKGDSPRCCQLCSKSADMSKWQPKAAEPQSWEQRLRENHPYCTKECNPTLIADIHTEIERAREEEKHAILRFLGDKLGALPFTQEAIEQNKHREGGE